MYYDSLMQTNVRAPKSWTFAGSNDNENWTDLDVRAGRSLRPARTTTFSYDSLVELRRVLSEVGLAGDVGRRPEAGAGDNDA